MSRFITFQGNTPDVIYKFDCEAQPLGEGGMGRVYRGIRESATEGTREVAIKCIKEDMPESVINRAREEASIRIRNENLVEMIDFVVTDDRDVLGQPVSHYHVISELLMGVSLNDILQGKTEDQEGNTIEAAVELVKLREVSPYVFAHKIIRGVLRGLMELHTYGYIHRDLDPTNIMITSDNKIKIIDFGITKKIVGSIRSSNTSLGQFLGKATYAAPELITGDINNQNYTTDLYQVGGMLFHLLTGEPPFQGPDHQVMKNHLNDDFPLKKVRQRKIAKVIKKAVAKDQQDRYQTALEFLSELEKLRNVPYTRSLTDSLTSVILPWP